MEKNSGLDSSQAEWNEDVSLHVSYPGCVLHLPFWRSGGEENLCFYEMNSLTQFLILHVWKWIEMLKA